MNEQRGETGLKRDPWIKTSPPGGWVHTSHQPNADKFCYHSSLTDTSGGKNGNETFLSIPDDCIFKQLFPRRPNQPTSSDSEKNKLPVETNQSSAAPQRNQHNQDTANIP